MFSGSSAQQLGQGRGLLLLSQPGVRAKLHPGWHCGSSRRHPRPGGHLTSSHPTLPTETAGAGTVQAAHMGGKRSTQACTWNPLTARQSCSPVAAGMSQRWGEALESHWPRAVGEIERPSQRTAGGMANRSSVLAWEIL